ncbi:MAG: hypothetical protein H7A32_01290 [Deltaproteobacteria bacterium]|nr:hypothetical protein [Deltaproteobacteria bacterium]
MYHSLPKETLGELLLYIAEHEEFNSLKNLKTVTHKQFIQALKDLAHDLIESSLDQGSGIDILMSGLNDNVKEILEKLPKQDRVKLIKGFLD